MSAGETPALTAITPDILRNIAKTLLTGYAQAVVLSAADKLEALSTVKQQPTGETRRQHE